MKFVLISKPLMGGVFCVKDDEPLSWKQRMRVAIGTASVMQYLHGLGGSPVTHGDLTSHNVLLTDDFSAKVMNDTLTGHMCFKHTSSILRKKTVYMKGNCNTSLINHAYKHTTVKTCKVCQFA